MDDELNQERWMVATPRVPTFTLLPNLRRVLFGALVICVGMTAVACQREAHSDSQAHRNRPVITATPNPAPCGDGLGVTNVAWDTGNESSGYVFVSEDGTEPRLFAAGARGSKRAAWVRTGVRYEFRLYADEAHTRELASVVVTCRGNGFVAVWMTGAVWAALIVGSVLGWRWALNANRVAIVAGAERFAALALLLVSLILFARLVAAVPLSGTWLLDLDPLPDGEQYFAGAMSLAREGRFGVHVAGHLVPPQYPFGYSALMVPFLWAGLEPVTVPFIVNRAVGLTLIVAVFLWLWRTERPAAAGVAAVLLATLPSFIILCRSPMSEVSASAAVLAAVLGLRTFARRGRLLAGVCGAFVLGVSVSFRVANVFFVLAIPSVAIMTSRIWAERVKTLLMLASAYVIGAAPILWYNWRHLGSPFRFGYALWVPKVGTLTTAFGVSNLRMNLTEVWQEVTQTEVGFEVSNLFGNGSYYGPAFVALVALMLFGSRRTLTFRLFTIPVMAYTVMMLLYELNDQRFLFPVLLLAVPAVAVSAADVIRRAFVRRDWRSVGSAIAVSALLVAAALGYPDRDGRIELGNLANVTRFQGRPPVYTVIGELNRLATGRRMLIFTDAQTPFVYALTRGDRIVSPIRTSLEPEPDRYTPEDREAQRRWALADGTVFAAVVATATGEIPTICPAPQGFEWHVVFRRGDTMAIAELQRRP